MYKLKNVVNHYIYWLKRRFFISLTVKLGYEEALREYYTTREDFSDVVNYFNSDPYATEYIYDIIKNKKVCIAISGGRNNKNEFIHIIFYTIRSCDGGFLAYSFMHECGHVIDQNSNGSGFEIIAKIGEKNQYDYSLRKYERFNETINDMLTIEAVEILQDMGIYLIEPKEFTPFDISDCNTSLFTKKVLQTLLQKFRKQVIKAKINVNPEELTRYIGADNFEELVDIVNKVDYLSKKDLSYKIKTSPEDPVVLEYFEHLQRLEQVYTNIDNYYAKFTETIAKDIAEESGKRR